MAAPAPTPERLAELAVWVEDPLHHIGLQPPSREEVGWLLTQAGRLAAMKPATDEEIRSALKSVPGADICTWGEGVEQGFYSGVLFAERRLLETPVAPQPE